MKYKAYYRPQSVPETVELLASLEGPVVLFAGGTDILIYAREDDRYADSSIVNIFGLPELKGITLLGDEIRIGAGVTHTEIEQSPIIQKYAKVLADACRTIGSLQIRDHATIAGNICNASPAADSLAALAILDAKIEYLHEGKPCELPLVDLIAKPYKTVLTDRDLVTCIRIRRLPDGTQTVFYKLGRRKALAISRMTIALLAHRAADGTVDDFNITVGATFPKPYTFPEINGILLGKKPDPARIAEIAQAISAKIPEIAGIRKSTTFKQPVCRNMTARLLNELFTEA